MQYTSVTSEDSESRADMAWETCSNDAKLFTAYALTDATAATRLSRIVCANALKLVLANIDHIKDVSHSNRNAKLYGNVSINNKLKHISLIWVSTECVLHDGRCEILRLVVERVNRVERWISLHEGHRERRDGGHISALHQRVQQRTRLCQYWTQGWWSRTSRKYL